MNSQANKFRLLVIDDDPLIRESIPEMISENWQAQCYEKLEDMAKGSVYDAALVDLHLLPTADGEGLEVIAKLAKSYPHLEIVAMSGDLTAKLMETSLKSGASRFIAKPLNHEELNLTLSKIESWFLLQKATLRTQQRNVGWVGTGTKSQSIRKKISLLKGEKGPILLEGESGTGKEVVAALLHQQNGKNPFIPINVAAIPENLFESELFGHNKGAFTGADQNKMGLAEAAHQGTLFIDEIEALPMNMQVKLLRFLESGEVKRVGSKDVMKVNCFVIVATNRNLEEMVKAGEFREDLLWRIKSCSIELPPLRHRKDDIKELAQYFLGLDQIRKKYFNEEALQALTSYDWPGNVRELKRCCEQLLITCPLPMIRLEDVQKVIGGEKAYSPIVSSENINLNEGLNQLVGQYEAQVIAKSLDQYQDIDEAARTLKISRSSLYKKIKDFDIDWRN